MRYYKLIDGGYIVQIGTGLGGEKITEAEYSTILGAFDSRPVPPSGFDYRLRDDLTWEAYELPPQPELEPTSEDKAEAYDILMGGAI